MVNLDSFAKKTAKHMNIAKNVIYNKYVLYFVFFIALVNLYINAVNRDYIYCAIFILLGFVATFFSKNLTVILVLAVIFATLLSSIINGKHIRLEGFEQNIEDDTNEPSNYINSSRGNTTKVFGEKDYGKDSDNKDSDNKDSNNKDNKDLDISDVKLSGNASPTPTKLMESLKEQAFDLQDTQKNIINGFQKIEPYMDRAESLIESIQKTADNIRNLKNSSMS